MALNTFHPHPTTTLTPAERRFDWSPHIHEQFMGQNYNASELTKLADSNWQIEAIQDP